MLNPSSDRVAVLDALRTELDGGPATGFQPSRDAEGSVQASFTTIVVQVTRAEAN
jgi:hypothetical protein